MPTFWLFQVRDWTVIRLLRPARERALFLRGAMRPCRKYWQKGHFSVLLGSPLCLVRTKP